MRKDLLQALTKMKKGRETRLRTRCEASMFVLLGKHVQIQA